MVDGKELDSAAPGVTRTAWSLVGSKLRVAWAESICWAPAVIMMLTVNWFPTLVLTGLGCVKNVIAGPPALAVIGPTSKVSMSATIIDVEMTVGGVAGP